ncbi:cytochrome-c peroxidase [Polaribacter sp. MED152]|uniref:cytochrome-c peroxidase n=1 Tax=Polaribacter sp. MED152 TaxID=313598 RepID=UPI000068C9F5|nr:cytochrome c peroxidase [Polaribacter sp. MED152]EAQ41809.1 di-hem cytochrome c peroxidase [Polaribacter sp. MED152]
MTFTHKFLTLLLVVSFLSCSSENEYLELTDDVTIDIDSNSDLDILAETLNLPANSFNYENVILPNHFLANGTAQEDNTPNNNPITDEGATLGRVLFYDKQLSVNNAVSCASCHDQSTGFSDVNTLSVGFNGELTARNSMGLANAKFYDNGRFFWDERAESLEEQVLLPIQDAVEMGLTLDELESKLQNEAYYSVLFTRAFGDDEISSERIALALAQFVRSMVSYQSKYDEGLAQTNNQNANFPNFTASENLGKNLFFSNRTRCSDCHDTNAFVGDRARNNGLDAVLTDEGRNDGEFKVPSLRNIELTAPFMHDGRFSTLEEVIEHYNSGVQNSAELDGRLRQGNGVRRLNLTDTEKQALVNFLRTLTDEEFIFDEKFSDPFINNE